MFDLIIFDCDGVLVDSEPIAAKVMARHLEKLGLTLTAPEIEAAFMGLTMTDVVAKVAALSGCAVPATWLDDLQRDTFAAFDAGLQPVPGIRAVVEDLARRGVRFCVASSGSQAKIRHSLGLTGLLGLFDDDIFSATGVGRGKPAPDLFLHAAKAMGAKPENTVVIEDSLPGVAAARAAQMAVLGFAPHGPGNQLAAAGARVFHGMTELPALLDLAAQDPR